MSTCVHPRHVRLACRAGYPLFVAAAVLLLFTALGWHDLSQTGTALPSTESWGVRNGPNKQYRVNKQQQSLTLPQKQQNALDAVLSTCARLKDDSDAQLTLAEGLYAQARVAVTAADPHPHYLEAYAEQESLYWGPVIPQWMVAHACRIAYTGRLPTRHLDVGIAYGTLALIFHAASGNNSEIFGIDTPGCALSPTLVRQYNITADYMNIELHTAPTHFAGFDAIIMTETIEHLNFLVTPTLLDLHSRLAPEGVLWLSTPHGGPPGYENTRHWAAMRPQGKLRRGAPGPEYIDGHVYEWGPTELREAFTQTGFTLDCTTINVARHGHLILQASTRPVPLCIAEPHTCSCEF